MRQAIIKRFDGGVDLVDCYTFKDFDWINVSDAKLNTKHRKGVKYFKTFCTFDIESTTIIPSNEELPPYGFMYHWQMTIGGVPVYGRTWKEWVDLLGRICDWLDTDRDNRLVVYVHNLGFELEFIIDFINKYFGGCEVFASKPRKPIRVICGNGLEFRCSYFLTNMSLSKACENEKGVIHPKADGDLDYKQIRTADTELTDIEFGYCMADVICLHELITNRMKNECDDLESIPITSTGYVRRDCRNATRKDPNYRSYFLKNRMSPKVYTLLKECGRGGNTHANRFMSGRVWENAPLYSYDVVSSYPSQLMMREFPCRRFSYYGEVETLDELHKLVNSKPCLFRIVFTNLKVKPRTPMPYIPVSKGLKFSSDVRIDNGRVLSASVFHMTVTDIDFKIIENEYSWSNILISDMYVSKYAPLPDALRGQVMEYFKLKTELKDKIAHAKTQEEKDDLSYLYAKSKNRLNGIFGMSYTDPVRNTVELLESGEWVETTANIEESLNKYYDSWNSFMVYAVGVWTTCWARLTLEDLLIATNTKGNKCIYCDTDSSKAIIKDESPILELNKKIIKECERTGSFVDVNGTRYYMGIYERENEEPLINFKTLGAKKYVYTDNKGLHVTISGVNKKLGAKELKTIDNFRIGFIFKDSGGSTLYYNDEGLHFITVEGCTMLTGSNIGIIDSTYQIGITGEYAELIGVNIYEEQ